MKIASSVSQKQMLPKLERHQDVLEFSSSRPRAAVQSEEEEHLKGLRIQGAIAGFEKKSDVSALPLILGASLLVFMLTR